MQHLHRMVLRIFQEANGWPPLHSHVLLSSMGTSESFLAAFQLSVYISRRFSLSSNLFFATVIYTNLLYTVVNIFIPPDPIEKRGAIDASHSDGHQILKTFFFPCPVLKYPL